MEKIGASVRKGGLTVTRNEITLAAFVLAGFLCGRVIAFEYMNPVVIAYLSVFLGASGTFYITCLAALLGLITNITKIAFIEYLVALALLGAVNYLVVQNRITVTDTLKSAAAGGCALAGSALCAALDGMNGYLLIIGAAEAIATLSLTYIFIIARNTLTKTKKATLLSNEQLVSVSALMGVCFIGMADISVKGIYLRDVLSLSAALMFAYAGGAGAGATCGLIFAIIMFAGAKYSAAYTGILGVAGIAGGIFGDFGKAGSIAGFIIGAVITALYLDRALITPDYFITLGVAGVIFLLVPKGASDKIKYGFITDGSSELGEYADKIKKAAEERLKSASDSFKLLANTFSRLSEKKEAMSQKDVSKLIDKIAENACKGCEGFDGCWKNSFYATYQAVFALLAASDKRGYISTKDIPESLSNRCTDLTNFTEITNRIFMLHKTNIKWHNRIIESRELVSQQLAGVSEIMNGLSGEIGTLVCFNDKLEKVISEELLKQRIGVDSVIVLENKAGRYEVDLTAKGDFDMRTLGKSVLSTVSEVLGRKMTRENAVMLGSERGVKIRLQEARRFNVTTGVARAAKSGQAVSGDNYTWMELKNGRSVIALSDGMGSGEAANEESKAAIEILEQFLESGFDKELAIKMLNSVLLLKSDEDFFTTLDLLCVDLYTGICEVVKIGAVETFLLRGGAVRVIRQSGLPAGIVANLDIETSTLSLQDGDILIIVSDGITEAGRPEKDFSWVTDALADFKSLNPQYIAEYILERAKALSGPKIKDDMTVLAVRVWVK